MQVVVGSGANISELTAPCCQELNKVLARSSQRPSNTLKLSHMFLHLFLYMFLHFCYLSLPSKAPCQPLFSNDDLTF